MNRITASALVLGVAVVMGSASDAKAFFGLLGGGCGDCCEPTCCAEPTCGCEPMCCDPCCEPRRGCCLLDGLKGLFKRRSHCCDPCCEPACCAEPTCCAPEPTCCAEPTCGCEPVCCDPCCEPRRGCCLLDGLKGLFKRRSHGCCDPCCEPTCGLEPSCGCGY